MPSTGVKTGGGKWDSEQDRGTSPASVSVRPDQTRARSRVLHEAAIGGIIQSSKDD
jgi:hypothetical protein